MRRHMTMTDGDARQLGRDQRDRNAQIFLRADEMVGIVSLEGQAQQRRDGTERDVALVPVEAQAKHFLAFERALADHASVDHRGGVRACFRAGQAEARNVTPIGKTRQPAVLLLPGAEAHQEFTGSKRVRHHHGDGGRQRARRHLAYHFRMRVGREAEPAMFFRDDHPEEFVALDEVPYLGRQIAPFPVDLPVVEHRAELIDRTMEESLLLRRQRGRRLLQQLRPVRIAGEEIGIPPDITRLERLALGVGHRRQNPACPGEDRLGDKIAAEGAHGAMSSCRRRGLQF